MSHLSNLAKASLYALAFIGFSPLLYGCWSGADESAKGGEHAHFNLDSLVETQILLFEQERPEVEKFLKMKGLEERITLRDINWRDELGFFLRADISKPSLQDSYEVIQSDGSRLVYKLKEGSEFPVQHLEVLKNAENGQVTNIAIVVSMENTLFDSVRNLKLKLTGKEGDNRIVSYEISGFNRLALGEKEDFEVKGLIKPL